jgi:HEAT repeat protein
LAGTERNAAPLLVALDDPSLTTTRAVIEALARTPSTGIGERLMAFAEDSHRNPDLRSDAVGALAQRCDHGMVPRLIALVNHQVDPVLPPPEQAVGHAALAAIAHIDPARARALLRQLDGNAFAVAAVERAAQGACPSR